MAFEAHKTMRNREIGILAAIFTVISCNLHADAIWGQYHVVPNGQDVQYLTLRPRIDSSVCPGTSNEQTTYALYLVNEYDAFDRVFRVPPNSVFLLTDIQFAGISYITAPAGSLAMVPTFSVYANYALPVYFGYLPKAIVTAPPLKGVKYETFQATRSYSTGAAFAAGNYLCVSLAADTEYSTSTLSLNLGDEADGTDGIIATLQGVLITNYRQGTAAYEPLFNW